MTATQLSQRRQTAAAVLQGYNSLSVSQILAPFDDQLFTHRVLPESLGMPARDKDAFAKHAAGITAVFEKFRMEPKDIFEDPVSNAVIINARMVGTLVNGMGSWENEGIMIIKFSEDGKSVVGIEEFVDSAKAKKMQESMKPKDF